MNYIEKQRIIKREMLNDEHYFQTLLEQSYAQRILSGADIEKLQLDCLAILAKQTERYNNGSSSSIRIEKAQDMLASIVFTLGVQLKTYQSPEDALTALQQEGVETIFSQGSCQLDRLIQQSKVLHGALLKELLPLKNVFYAATIGDGIKGFFKLYRPEFAAQEIHITADYPVYNKAKRLQGIEFIAQYLEQLYYENAFCRYFSAETIHHLLCGYDLHYEKLLLNLYEPVLAASLGCVLGGAKVESLEITPEVQATLRQQLNHKEKTEITKMLATALTELSSIFSFPESLGNYVKQSLPLLAGSIKSALNLGTLERVFLIPKNPDKIPTLRVSDGVRMPDELYRKVLDEFQSCRYMADKVAIIKEQVHSLVDFNDLLLDAEPTVEEIVIILKELNPAELAALMKKYRFLDEISDTQLRDNEITLLKGLQSFAAALSPEQQEMLEMAVAVVEVTASPN